MGGIGAGIQGMSGAGLLVVSTLCGSLVLVVLTACAFALIHPTGELPEYLGQLLVTLTPLVAGLLAKTYADARSAGGAEPAPVTVVNNAGDPVPTTDVAGEEGVAPHELEVDPPARRRR